jgi:hypothetical protein
MIIEMPLQASEVATGGSLEWWHAPACWRICGVCPYPLAIFEEFFRVSMKSSTLPCCGVVGGTSRTHSIVDDQQVVKKVEDLNASTRISTLLLAE